MKFWTCGSCLLCGSRKDWKRNPNGFLSRLVTMDETWLYHYDPETKQHLMECRRSGSLHPKNIECKYPLEKFSPRFFFLDQDDILLIDYLPRAKLSTRSVAHLYWCNWRTFWRKNAAEGSQKGSCSCTTMPQFTGHLHPRRNWPTWASSVLTTHPILRTWPRRTTTCSLDWKKQLKVCHFSSDEEVIAAAETWLDGKTPEFFWVFCKS